MHKNLQVTDPGKIIVHIGDERLKKKWGELFLSDEHRISHLILNGDVRVEYCVNKVDGLYDAVLSTDDEFSYQDAEKILDRMYQHNIGEKDWYSNAYMEAFQKLRSGDRVFLPDNNPSFAIYFDHEDMIIRELGILHNIAENKSVMNLAHHINNAAMTREDIRNHFHSLRIVREKNEVFFYGFALLNDFADLLIQCIEDEMAITKESKHKLITLAINNFIKHELAGLELIAHYPSSHPLSKYKSAALVIIDIFRAIEAQGIDNIGKDRMRMLRDAVSGSDIFSEVPPIIMRSIVKMRYRFSRFVTRDSR